MINPRLKKLKPIIFAVILLLLILIGILFYFFTQKKPQQEQSQQKNELSQTSKGDVNKQNTNEKNYLVEGYPLDVVPLYKLRMISSSKFFVNKDPLNIFGYFESPVNYYNVVFETEADRKDLLEYYESLMSEVDRTFVSEEKVDGKIGKYKVSVSHYGNNPKNYAYLQVYLPKDEYQEKNKFEHYFPNIVVVDDKWIEYESSYGLLNQKNGEQEFTKYFPITIDDIQFDLLVDLYIDKYKDKQGFVYDEKSGLMQWKDGVYSISMTFSTLHKRIYLMIRYPIE